MKTIILKEQGKIKSGKALGLTLGECCELMKGKVAHHNTAGKDIFEKGFYARGRNYRPEDGGGALNVDIYILDERNISMLCYNTTRHRAAVALNMYNNGTYDDVPAEIWRNYLTNGYTTRCGVRRAISKIEKIRKIARSHADYLGQETGSSSNDHINRVRMRA